MEAKAQKKYIPISPGKLRLLVKEVKELSPVEALARLRLVNKKGARILVEVLKQAIDNAKNLKIEPEKLKFKKVVVGNGSRLKRRDRFHGARFDPGIIQKRTSHLKIILEEKGEDESKKKLKS